MALRWVAVTEENFALEAVVLDHFTLPRTPKIKFLFDLSEDFFVIYFNSGYL